jgi:hypothetical protein
MNNDELIALQNEVANTKINRRKFAIQFAERVEHEQIAFDVNKWQWSDVWTAVEFGAVKIREIRYMIQNARA